MSVPVAAVSSPAEFHLKQRTHSDPEHDPHYGGTPPGRSNQMVTFSDKVGTRHMSMTEEKHLRRGDTRRLTANFSGQYDRYTMYGKSGTSPVNPSPYMQYSKSLDTPPSYLAHLFDNCPDSPSLDNYRNDQALTIAGSGKGIPNYLGPFVKDPYTAAPFTLPTSQVYLFMLQLRFD